jgi:hypothetical protein
MHKIGHKSRRMGRHEALNAGLSGKNEKIKWKEGKIRENKVICGKKKQKIENA